MRLAFMSNVKQIEMLLCDYSGACVGWEISMKMWV